MGDTMTRENPRWEKKRHRRKGRFSMCRFSQAIKVGLVGMLAVLLSSTLWADTLVLKDGKVLQGTFMGGTATVIQFEAAGAVQQVAVADVTSLTISPRAVPQAPPPPQQTAAQGPVTVPAGTKLMVKLEKAVNTQKDKAGASLAGYLDMDLTVNGVTVAPKGSKLYGKVVSANGGRLVGKPAIAIQYTDLVVGNQQFPIVTDAVGAEGERSGAVRKVAAGALIGVAVDGPHGAGTGARVGGGVAVLAGGKHIQIAAGTLAEIVLKEPLTISR
jgi:hypothetical protein